MALSVPLAVVAAPGAFKECLSAAEAARAIEAGIRAACPEARVVRMPMADGGEGTVEALVAACGGQMAAFEVTGPLGDPVEARYGLINGGQTAVVEMAEAAGLHLVPPAHRNPLHTTTRGLGELLAHALNEGARQVILGIGGSATCDGGAGMAQALGWRLLDGEGRDLEPGGGALTRLEHIDPSGVLPALEKCAVRAACDVGNPLYGPAGAAHVYAPQKGADEAAVEQLDQGLRRLAKVIERDLGGEVSETPGAGAAGGLGAGLMAFAGATLEPGAALVAEACGLDAALAEADLVITGEGALDAQTVQGKTISGICAAASRRGVPVVALAGVLRPGHEALYERGLSAAFAIADGPMDAAEAFARVRELLSGSTANAVRLFRRS